MADENWQKIREIFDAALEKEPRARQDYLLAACGEDKNLLAEIESLFSTFDKLDSFLEKPAVEEFPEVIEVETRKLERGKHLAHYEIIEQIGAGGMGEVYLARDKKLDRKVAIKMLNEKFAAHESNLQRFISEAKTASGLNHPNILTIYEFGESENAHFIVSEFIKGKTLRRTLKENFLSLTEILDIAIQIAGALAAAHEAHLVHRDIKPENIMIRPDGYVKVLDFGLAKLVERKNQSILGLNESTTDGNKTAKGIILGTVNYMSPEQAKGKKVDERTDIFSLGAVVYEMLTGKAPFAGDSTSETFANLIKTEPEPLSNFVSNVPDDLQRIISGTLRKNKDERYLSIKDLLADLKELRENLSLNEKLERTVSSGDQATEVLQATTGDANKQTAEKSRGFSQQIRQRKSLSAFVLIALAIGFGALGYYLFLTGNSAGKKSIAVLPLKPIHSTNRDEIYEIGIADSLIHRLGSVKNFIVRPLSATRKYADIGQDPLVAGKEQRVDYVLDSNYQLVDGKIRLTSQLINVASGEIEETYKTEKDSSGIFMMQDAIAADVINKLQKRFGITPSSPAAKRGTTNEEAYRLYLQGKYLTMRRNSADSKKAVEYLEQAIRLDPNFALAYAQMAHAYRKSIPGGDGEYEKIKGFINKALELDPDLAEAYVARADVYLLNEWNFPAVEKDLLHALELEPNNDTAHWLYSLLLAYRGHFDDALAEIETAQAIDPAAAMYKRDRGRILYYARRYDEAIAELKQVVDLDENMGAGWLRYAYGMKGDQEKAYETFIKNQKRLNPDLVEIYQKTYAAEGWQGVRRKILELSKSNEKIGNGFYQMAILSVHLGEKEQAFEYLNKAVERREWWVIMMNVDPPLEPLRGDPRFGELVARVGIK